MNARGEIAVPREPAQLDDAQAQGLGELLGAVEGRQAVLGLALFRLGHVEAVEVVGVVPVDAFAHMHDVVGLVGLPRRRPQRPGLGGLTLELLFVLLQLLRAHPVGGAALHEEALRLKLLPDVVVDAARGPHREPQRSQVAHAPPAVASRKPRASSVSTRPK